MVERLLPLGFIAALVLGASPTALAKCCPLDYVLVSDSRGHDIRIDASELEDRLQDWELQLLSWPVLNGMSKGDNPPPGELGPSYVVTYVHEAGDYEGEVSVRERMYPFARPRPVAFTLKGQTQDWIAQDQRVYAVESGWRPVEEGIISVLFEDAADRVVSSRDDASKGDWHWTIAAGIAAAVLISLLLMKRRLRRAR